WPMASGTEEGGGASGSPSRIVCCARAETASNNETASPRPSLERPNAAPARGAAGGAAAQRKVESLAILRARAYHGAPRGPGALLAYDGRVVRPERRRTWTVGRRCCIRLAGASPAAVRAGVPRSRLRVTSERAASERSVKSPARAIWPCARGANLRAQCESV